MAQNVPFFFDSDRKVFFGADALRTTDLAAANPGAQFQVIGGDLWESNGLAWNPNSTSVGDDSPDTLAQPIPFNALQTWQRYEFPAGSNITYIVAQNTHPTETMMVYLDADSTAARDAICGTNGAPVVNNVPVPGLFYVPPLSTVTQPLQAALSNGTYGGGVIDARLKNSAAAACDNLITAG